MKHQSPAESPVRRYPLIVEGTEGNYSGYFPDLPGCATGGATLDELRANAKEALLLYFEEQGKPELPEASEPVGLEFVEINRSELDAWTSQANAPRSARAG